MLSKSSGTVPFFTTVAQAALRMTDARPATSGLLLACVVAISAVGLSLEVAGAERKLAQAGATRAAERIGATLQSTIDAEVRVLTRYSERWLSEPDMGRKHWEADARVYSEFFPRVPSLHWIGPLRRTVWSYRSAEPARTTAWLDSPAVARVLNQAAHSRAARIGVVGEHSRGEAKVLLVVPVVRGPKIEGFLATHASLGGVLGGMAMQTRDNLDLCRVEVGADPVFVGSEVTGASGLRAKRIFKTAGQYWSVEVWPSRSGGSAMPFVILAFGLAMSGLAGGLLAMGGVMRRRAAMLEQQSKELERFNAELEQYVYVASHDLKAPLRAIEALAGWIQEDLHPDSEESREHLTLMRGRVKRMSGLLDALLEYGKVGKSLAPVEWVDTQQLVAETFDLVQTDDRQRLRIGPGMPTILTYKAPFQQVVLNLLSNALKHHDRPDPLIEVDCRPSEDFWVFAVKDDGPGIAPQYAHKVFQMFQTLKPRDEVEGCGMGLAVVKKTVESFGGQIHLHSVGRGAEFTFAWPKGQDERRATIGRKRSPSLAGRG